MASRVEYLDKWFDLSFPKKYGQIDMAAFHDWLLAHVKSDDLLLQIDYDFSDELTLCVSSSWEGNDMIYWTTGKESGWTDDGSFMNLKELMYIAEAVDFSGANDMFLKLVIDYMHTQVLPKWKEFAVKKYEAFVFTTCFNGIVSYID